VAKSELRTYARASPPDRLEGKARAAADANSVMTSYRAPAAPVAESDAAVGWRRDRLLDVGCAPQLAARLAGDCGIDLHAVLELIDRGCPPELAARILAPLDDDRRPC
jgi:hypothetical protein